MAARSRREKLGTEPKITPGKRKLLQHGACLWSLLTRVNVPHPNIHGQQYTIYAMAITAALSQSISSSSYSSPRAVRRFSTLYELYYYKSIEKKIRDVHTIYPYNIISNIPLGQIDYSESSTVNTTSTTYTHFYTYIWNGNNMLDARTIDHTQDRILRYIINARITMTVFVSDNGVFGRNKKWNPQTRSVLYGHWADFDFGGANYYNKSAASSCSEKKNKTFNDHAEV